ncbi:hypothetical protein JCM11251_006093 [Rhodosporidiobolus azoricus]
MYAWQAQAALKTLPQPSTSAPYPSHALSTPLALPPSPLSQPALPAPPATDVHGARIKLTLDKVRLELAAVKTALEDVKRLGEGVEGMREEVRLMRVGRDEKDAALEKRILASISDLLSPHFSTLSSSLDQATTSILGTVRTHAKRVEVRVEGVEEAVEKQGEKVKSVVEEVKSIKDLVAQVSERTEDREYSHMKKLGEVKSAVEAQVGALMVWEKRVIVVEKRIQDVEESLSKRSSPSFPATDALPRPASDSPGTAVVHLASAPPATFSTSSSDSPIKADSPPRRRPPRRTLLPAVQSSSVPSLPSSAPHTSAFVAAEGTRTVSAPQPPGTASEARSDKDVQLAIVSPDARIKRRLLAVEQEEHLSDEAALADKAAPGSETSKMTAVSANLSSSTSASSPRSTKRRRVIPQDVTPSGTPEEGGESGEQHSMNRGRIAAAEELEDEEEPATQ